MANVSRELIIDRLGARGDGIALSARGAIFVPYALAGETVLAEVDGDRGRLAAIVAASPDRIDAVCEYFSVCGGCAVQTLRYHAYARWKQDLVVRALQSAGVAANVAPLVDCHGGGRRRVTLHAATDGPAVRLGFMRARSHDLVNITHCPLLAPSLQRAPAIARAIANELSGLGKPLDIQMTAAANGLDVDIRGCGPLRSRSVASLASVAESHDLARVTNHGEILALRRPPLVRMGSAQVVLPAGGFLQVTEAAEAEISRRVEAIVAGSRHLADLYCGVGTFALRLAAKSTVSAFDSDAAALAALAAAHRTASNLRTITTHVRDLGRHPLLASELAEFDALVLDPPRIGAEAQAHEIARAGVPVVAVVSCSAASFARDASILIGGGYALESVTPLEQFRFSSHVEIIGHFVHPIRQSRRRLLG